MNKKTEYVKLEFESDRDIAKAYADSDLYYMAEHGFYRKVSNLHVALHWMMDGQEFYQKEKNDVDIKEFVDSFIANCNMINKDFSLDDYLELSMGSYGEETDNEFVALCKIVTELTNKK